MTHRPSFALAAVAAVLMLAGCGEGGAAPEAAPKGVEAAAAEDPGVSMPDDAPPQEEALPPESAASGAANGEAIPCISDFGQDVAENLVRRCIAVSPATRPPCNVQNPCQMMQDEIDRACAMYGPGETKPAECDPYQAVG